MKPTPTQIELAVKRIVEAVPERSRAEGWEWTRGKWTKAIKQSLCDYARKQGFRVAASGCTGAEESEFLYDMTWWKQEGDFMTKVPLILESELQSPSYVIDKDFYKLMLGRAEHRVWIFERKTEAQIDETFEAIINSVMMFANSTPGDRYLLMGVDWNPRKFRSKLYVHK
ncbi:hypothetical protein [Methylotetracoccus oryzae]|uniref:hypothetical protein n=1 Tax=Methylotetracoccus oryzae TaxID=1919059 RepID=UPI001118E2EE|nr:hypothetical protein [Methylotetracoccus oryzae]